MSQPSLARRGGAALSVVVGLVRLVLTVGLLAAGAWAAWWFNAHEGTVARGAGGGAEEASRLVETVAVRRGDHPVRLRALGTVRPAREALVRPRISGMIVEQAEAFEPGGSFDAGAFMVQVDRADYEQAIAQRESDLAQAEADLQVELGDQAVAREELALLETDVPEANRDLILRIPQVNRAKARVRAAEAALESARLDLERTRIVAPFAGHVVDRSVSVGNNVSAGDELVRLVGSGTYWVELSVPVSTLRWIETPRPDVPGSGAVVRYPRGWGEDAERRGHVARLVGRLEAGTRLARLLVAVDDPLALEPGNAEAPALILDAFVDVEIEGRTVADCVVLPRELVREGDTVWVMNDRSRLETRTLEIAVRSRDHAWITGGLRDGDRVVRTNLVAPVDGMLLREASSAMAPQDAITDAREVGDG